MRIIWCGGRLSYTINLAQLLNDFIVKTLPVVTVYFWLDSISVKSLIYQGFSYSFHLLVQHYNCYTKFRECIGHYYDILFPIFARVHLHEIYA